MGSEPWTEAGFWLTLAVCVASFLLVLCIVWAWQADNEEPKR